jgi:type IV pilus assembly protein PilX
MKTELKPMMHSRKQRGAALVVGLVLLVVVTVLAISGMNTATTELAIARNDQNFENAFQAAETGLELALSQGLFTTVPPDTALAQYNITENAYSVNTTIGFDTTTLVPDRAFSLGVRLEH